MALTRIYLDRPLASGEQIELGDQPFRHLATVLKIRPGEPFILFNGDGCDYHASVLAVARRSLTAAIDRVEAKETESPIQTTLALCLSKGDRFDYAVQKSVELGVNRIVPLLSRRSAQLGRERFEKKQQHWHGIAISAAEQCGRAALPSVAPVTSLTDWLATPTSAQRLFLDPYGESAPLSGGGDMAFDLLIGAEGGFDEEERAEILAAGYRPLRVGPRILRTETAPVVALTLLQARFGDLLLP